MFLMFFRQSDRVEVTSKLRAQQKNAMASCLSFKTCKCLVGLWNQMRSIFAPICDLHLFMIPSKTKPQNFHQQSKLTKTKVLCTQSFPAPLQPAHTKEIVTVTEALTRTTCQQNTFGKNVGKRKQLLTKEAETFLGCM